MTSAKVERVKVGRVEIPLERATTWVREYTDHARNETSEHPYAFPAYDCYESGTTEPSRLSDADLLAPVLLNVQIKVRTYYGLQRVRPQLEEVLKDPALKQPLHEADDFDYVESLVRDLYEVLDQPDSRVWGVGGTTLSKILHRKRPQSLVLHDRWVRDCYVGADAPVPESGNRSWAEYMALITGAIRLDIARQTDAFGARVCCTDG